MKTITADGGSTKTTWRINYDSNPRNGGTNSILVHTPGINPFHQTEAEMESIICNGLHNVASDVSEVHFYGAGCTKEKSPVLQRILARRFPAARVIEVASDMLGAAKALFGTRQGIACILGTGSNSCLYDGKGIVANVPPMGYILGDEGSGAVLGRTLVNSLYKGGHKEMRKLFEAETGFDATQIIERVYRGAMPNQFLASLAPFIREHLHEEAWLEDMVTDCFRGFFRNNVAHYCRPDLPCSFVGSIAFYFEEQLRTAAASEGVTIERIKKEPLA